MAFFQNMLKKMFAYSPDTTKPFELLKGKDEENSSGSGSQYKDKKNSEGNGQGSKEESGLQQSELYEVASDLQKNVEIIQKRFNLPKNNDIIIRELRIGGKYEAFLLFVEGAVDKKLINQFILPNLMMHNRFEVKDHELLNYIIKNVLTISKVKQSKDFSTISEEVLLGYTALFIEGIQECLLIESKGFEKRSVEKPVTENVVRGSQEGFSESLTTNISLIRKIIKNEKLVSEKIPMGKTNNSTCAVLYLEGTANPDLVNEVKRRIEQIDIDFVMGDGMLEQLIEDNPYMIFPQVLTTERPDRAASFIMEGEVLILSEGTPFANAVPVTFFRLFHTSEDSNLRWEYGTFLRLIRLCGMLTAVLIPGLYVALTLYHQEMIPTELLISIIKAREKVPFPVVVEVLLMELSFELIREGGIRVPGVIGQTLGIIGALILGQAAVAAGLVSPILIIIVAVTGLGSFAIPNYSLALAVRLLRFAFILLAGIAGFYGITIAALIICGLGCNMKSFGVPFFAPIAPRANVNPDVLIRQPIFKQEKRPDSINPQNSKRAGKKTRKWDNNGK